MEAIGTFWCARNRNFKLRAGLAMLFI